MTPEHFFTKNTKWFALAFLVLFLMKTVQSCNRGMKYDILQKQYTHVIDSLNFKYNKLNDQTTDSIKDLNYRLMLEQNKALSADERARAIQSTAEKIRANTSTSITIKGAEVVKDTTKKK